MKGAIIKRLNAVTLLIVFSLNTVVGFACSVGMDMGFNRSHHTESAVANHQHAHGDAKPHHHDEPAADHHSSKKEKDNCCKDEVMKFAKVDKQTPAPIVVSVPFLALAVVIPSYPAFDALAASIHTPNNWYFVRCHHPPIPDIRIAIQSFQI